MKENISLHLFSSPPLLFFLFFDSFYFAAFTMIHPSHIIFWQSWQDFLSHSPWLLVVFTTPTKLYLLTCGALKKKPKQNQIKPARLSLERQIEQWDACYKTSCGWKLSLDVSITLTVGINLWAICSEENYCVLSLAQHGENFAALTRKNTENIIRTLPTTAWQSHLWLAAVWGEKKKKTN